MTLPGTIRVFVNGSGVDVPPGSTALDAVRRMDPTAADAVERGARVVTDSRGLPVSRDVVVQAGSIFRLIPNRASPGQGPARGGGED
jgi:hypothetical protein